MDELDEIIERLRQDPDTPQSGRILGVPIDPVSRKPIEVKDERDHFHQCPICQGWVDRRDLGQVFYHESEHSKTLVN